MAGDRMMLTDVLAAAENAAPVRSLDVVARDLRERFGARYVSFLFVDIVGRRLLRVSDQAAPPREHPAEQVFLGDDSVYDEVLRGQKLVRTPQDAHGRGQRVLAPVTNRGDAIGVLELFLTRVTEEVLEQVQEVAHALAYIIVTDRRFTDLYHWGNRTTSVSLAAEIQRQLLPSASACAAPEFDLAGALVPASDIAGDTYDYSLDQDHLHLSITDAMGHDVDASLMATLAWPPSRSTPHAVPAGREWTSPSRPAGSTRRSSTTAGAPSRPASSSGSPSTAAAPSSSTPVTPGPCCCARGGCASSVRG